MGSSLDSVSVFRFLFGGQATDPRQPMKTAVSGCPGFLWEHCGYHRALYTLTSWLDTPELSTYHDLWLFGKERSPS